MLFIIINSKVGKRKIKKICKYLFNILDTRHIEYKHACTQYAGHAVEIARGAVENHDAKQIMIIGGDGTINEVLNGIMTSGIVDTSKIEIGLVPQGTANDWGQYWGLTPNYRKSIQTFLNGNITGIDIGCLTYSRNNRRIEHFFINSVGFGLDCKIVEKADKLKILFGRHKILYLIALLIVVFTHRSQKIAIKSDQRSLFSDNLYTMNIANGVYTGGGMKQTPDASPCDGMFDIITMLSPNIHYVLTAITCLFNGTLLQHPAINSYRSSKIEINYDGYLPFEADGIVVHAQAPYTISIMPKAICMIH